ncbi:hypothetical protein PUN28_009067 [Cardiocondyla obscurior]|uniref:Uncharacterized protein n=1 Tax=Cardiocondyla obscurior TaxID=286306 RepID=A0AAW2FW28_9HYME
MGLCYISFDNNYYWSIRLLCNQRFLKVLTITTFPTRHTFDNYFALVYKISFVPAHKITGLSYIRSEDEVFYLLPRVAQ